MTDAQLDRRIRRCERRLQHARGAGATDRIARLERRIGKLRGWRALPVAERPKRVKLTLGLVSDVVDAASVLLVATPAGPVLAAVKLALTSVEGLATKLKRQDVSGVLDAITEAARAELARTGVPVTDEDATLLAITDAIEDGLEPELAPG